MTRPEEPNKKSLQCRSETFGLMESFVVFLAPESGCCVSILGAEVEDAGGGSAADPSSSGRLLPKDRVSDESVWTHSKNSWKTRPDYVLLVSV